jgi:cell division septum initiation protein DivIVA
MAQAQVTQSLVHGVAPVLQALKQLEPDLYKTITADLKSKADPLRAHVSAGFPDKPYPSNGVLNWTKYGRTTRGRKPSGSGAVSFPKYDGKKARRGVTVQVGGRKVRRTNSYPIMRIKQSDAAGSIYDLAKNADKNRQFVLNLARSGEPSRVMWRRTKSGFPMIQKSVMATIDQIGKRYTRQIASETERRNNQSIRASAQARNALGRFGKAL